jgi:tripartite-type tricarboxylate transporter receptor subunit TctC
MLASTTDVRAGRLRALGVSTKKRTQSMPDVPTLQESGVAHYEVIQWSGMLAPHGTPRRHIDRINREVNTILDLPRAKQFFVSGGSETAGGTTQAFGQLIKSEIARWRNVIWQSKVKVND